MITTLVDKSYPDIYILFLNRPFHPASTAYQQVSPSLGFEGDQSSGHLDFNEDGLQLLCGQRGVRAAAHRS